MPSGLDYHYLPVMDHTLLRALHGQAHSSGQASILLISAPQNIPRHLGCLLHAARFISRFDDLCGDQW